MAVRVVLRTQTCHHLPHMLRNLPWCCSLPAKFQPHWPLGRPRSLGIPPSFKTQGLCTCCFLQLECSLSTVTSSLKPASSGSSWRVYSSERISQISQSTNIFRAWLSLPVWCFPSQQVLWPALPAFNTCLLHDTVEGHGGKPLDSAVYNWNTRALYQLITAEWQEQMKDLGTWVQDFRFPLHLPQTSCTLVRHHQYLSLNTVTAKCSYCSVYSTHSNNTLSISMPN